MCRLQWQALHLYLLKLKGMTLTGLRDSNLIAEEVSKLRTRSRYSMVKAA